MREEETDRTADEETDAAAAEAGAIGGPGADEDIDPAERPRVEAGEGEAEGFEVAERDLIEHASHGDPAPDPETLASDEQAHPEPEHGSADHVRSSEVEEEDTGH